MGAVKSGTSISTDYARKAKSAVLYKFSTSLIEIIDALFIRALSPPLLFCRLGRDRCSQNPGIADVGLGNYSVVV